MAKMTFDQAIQATSPCAVREGAAPRCARGPCDECRIDLYAARDGRTRWLVSGHWYEDRVLDRRPAGRRLVEYRREGMQATITIL